MLDFFQQRFSYIHQLNLSWMNHVSKDDKDIDWDIRLAVSKLINARHIAVCAILDQEIESDLDDVLPEQYWEQLERENYQQWMNVFMQYNQGIQTDIDWLTPLLFKALHENAQYLGQLKLLLTQKQMEFFDETLIPVV